MYYEDIKIFKKINDKQYKKKVFLGYLNLYKPCQAALSQHVGVWPILPLWVQLNLVTDIKQYKIIVFENKRGKPLSNGKSTMAYKDGRVGVNNNHSHLVRKKFRGTKNL